MQQPGKLKYYISTLPGAWCSAAVGLLFDVVRALAQR